MNLALPANILVNGRIAGTWKRAIVAKRSCSKTHAVGAGSDTILIVTRERWAQTGITVQFLIVVRTLGEIFRLRHIDAPSFSVAVAMPYVGGALIAVCACWVSVALYFVRRYTLSAWIALATIIVLLVYKLEVIGW